MRSSWRCLDLPRLSASAWKVICFMGKLSEGVEVICQIRLYTEFLKTSIYIVDQKTDQPLWPMVTVRKSDEQSEPNTPQQQQMDLKTFILPVSWLTDDGYTYIKIMWHKTTVNDLYTLKSSTAAKTQLTCTRCTKHHQSTEIITTGSGTRCKLIKHISQKSTAMKWKHENQPSHNGKPAELIEKHVQPKRSHAAHS